MICKPFLRKISLATVVAMGFLLSACDSDDDGVVVGGGDEITTLDVTLDSASTVPPANVDDATGSGSFTVDSATGAIVGSVTVSETTDVPTSASIHEGAPEVAGPVVLALDGSEDGTVWTIPEGTVLNAAGIELFENGELYVNVNTDENPAGELRSQLVDVTAGLPEVVSYQITFTNLSTGQLMTPPVVAIHDASIHLFEVGELSSDAVRDIAETGNNDALVAFAMDPENAELVSAADVAGDGPFFAGGTVMTTLASDQAEHVFSAVNMVICTNDGITGFDSISLPTDNEPLNLIAMAYDAGTRENQDDNESYFPPPCRTGDVDEAPENDPREPIALHPGQSGITVPVQDATPADANFDFAEGEQLLEIEIVRN